RVSNFNQLLPVPLDLNPYKPGEAIGATDCNTMTTPSGVAITGQAAINLGVFCGNNPDPIRPYPGYGDVNHIEEASSSTYHALQASVRRNVGQLTLSASYTYSHAIADASRRYDSSFVNAYTFAANRGSSNFDERHIFNFSYVWDIPFMKGSSPADKILGGWESSGIASVTSGPPFSV